ncbi:hypothetical protein [Chryseobacterium limigenitum]|nr:hypothetical protein [Chryseobacterium limigenitum]
MSFAGVEPDSLVGVANFTIPPQKWTMELFSTTLLFLHKTRR